MQKSPLLHCGTVSYRLIQGKRKPLLSVVYHWWPMDGPNEMVTQIILVKLNGKDKKANVMNLGKGRERRGWEENPKYGGWVIRMYYIHALNCQRTNLIQVDKRTKPSHFRAPRTLPTLQCNCWFKGTNPRPHICESHGFITETSPTLEPCVH